MKTACERILDLVDSYFTNMEISKIDSNLSPDEYHALINNDIDCVILANDMDKLTWFITRYTQFLCQQGGYEVIPIYGETITNLKDFCYQVNCSLPFGCRIRPDSGALYDLILNFETEPDNRVFIWHDAQHQLKTTPELFNDVTASLVVAGFLNRNAISTIKADNTRYKVNQRNIIVFFDTTVEELLSFLNRAYYIPSIDGVYDSKLAFQICEII